MSGREQPRSQEWRLLPGADEFLVSECGEIYNVNTQQSPSMGEAHEENKKGSLRFKAGRLGTMSVARAVAMAFGLPLPPGRTWGDNGEMLEVHHKNSDPTDNRVENLEVLTVSRHRQVDAEFRNGELALRGALARLQADGRLELSEMADRLVANTATEDEALAAVRNILARRDAILGGKAAGKLAKKKIIK